MELVAKASLLLFLKLINFLWNICNYFGLPVTALLCWVWVEAATEDSVQVLVWPGDQAVWGVVGFPSFSREMLEYYLKQVIDIFFLIIFW
jgi:hypothetical protein